MKSRKTFAGIAALAVIIALSWLVVPTAGAGDKGHPEGAENREGDQREGTHGIKAVLRLLTTLQADEKTILNKLAQVLTEVNDLKLQVSDGFSICSRPDLVPLNPSCVQGPINTTNLKVRVLNQGGKPADASTTRVAFTTFSGPVVVDVQTVALGGEGGFVDLEVPVPDNCFLSATGSVVPCHFEIDVDALFAVGEVFENNNRASGDCIAGIL